MATEIIEEIRSKEVKRSGADILTVSPLKQTVYARNENPQPTENKQIFRSRGETLPLLGEAFRFASL
jgi:hypothetical protein